jgi:hypothetical protein
MDKDLIQQLRGYGSDRRAGRQSQAGVTREYFEGNERTPLVLLGNSDIALVRWAASRLHQIELDLLEHGAILFRGFHCPNVKEFESFSRLFAPALLDYVERAAPRKEVYNRVYTSTEYPAHQSIPLHHEMSYAADHPSHLWLYCLEPAEQGGRTPIAHARTISAAIDPQIKSSFLSKGVMYVRNYSSGLDMTWEEAFQTDSKAKVEAYCLAHGLRFEWLGGGRLRTSRIGSAVAPHPQTGELFWFNHAHLFHSSTIELDVRAWMLSKYSEIELPRNVFYGDGSSIETSVISAIHELYEEKAARFNWEKEDVLMLDNHLAAHGRESFSGPRKILVTMAKTAGSRT